MGAYTNPYIRKEKAASYFVFFLRSMHNLTKMADSLDPRTPAPHNESRWPDIPPRQKRVRSGHHQMELACQTPGIVGRMSCSVSHGGNPFELH